MNPLMIGGLLPDGRRTSQEATARHAALAARRRPVKTARPRFVAWRLVPQT
ncbi:hypothetical protein [Microbacterium yannicii]|uniref:hypothetical protein n=1 Tax=Microbacterium yannicii TaxID=671622 RepID=UPI0002F520DE|nr:hypothetical protein [Microbacterium yannicii]